MKVIRCHRRLAVEACHCKLGLGFGGVWEEVCAGSRRCFEERSVTASRILLHNLEGEHFLLDEPVVVQRYVGLTQKTRQNGNKGGEW